MSDRVRDLHFRSSELTPMFDTYVELVNAGKSKRVKQSTLLRDIFETGLLQKLQAMPKAQATKVLNARGPEDRGPGNLKLKK